MKKYIVIIFALSLALFTSCDKDDDLPTTVDPTALINVSVVRTSSTTADVTFTGVIKNI